MIAKVHFQNGIYNGEAVLVLQKGEINYYNREGYGVMEYQGGMKYEGYWKNNERSGKGKVTYADGDVYIGTFYKNKKHGDGVLYRTNGDVYQMTFVLDRIVVREKIKSADKADAKNTIAIKSLDDYER